VFPPPPKATARLAEARFAREGGRFGAWFLGSRFRVRVGTARRTSNLELRITNDEPNIEREPRTANMEL